MANTDKEFDKYFKDKLVNHEEKTSALAWERLQNRLPKQEKKDGFPFLRIAASLILLIGLGYLVWFANQSGPPERTEMAEVKNTRFQVEQPTKPEQDVPVITKDTEQETEEKAATENLNEEKSIPKNLPNSHPKIDPVPQNTFESAKKSVAETVNPIEIPAESESMINEITLPELKAEEALAMENPTTYEDEDQGYTVKIISNGFAEKPEKEGLIEEIETKIDKIGGLLNKVDQGFADLQDAKNNFFASITTRKERK